MANAIGWNRRAIFSREALWQGAAEFLAGSVPAASGREPVMTVSRRAMACEFSVQFPGEFRAGLEAGFAALDEIDWMEERLSVFREESELSRINREAAAHPVAASPEVYALLRKAAALSRATGGAFDAAAGALVRAWGFLGGHGRVPEAEVHRAALAASGSRWVRLHDLDRKVFFLRPGVEFNLGGIGKGYALDRAVDRIRAEFGAGCLLMQGGQSSLRAHGLPSGSRRGWRVAIGDPLVPRRTLAAVFLRNQAMGTSAATHRHLVHRGQRLGHILDPRTGWPARRLLSASVIASTAAEADALSTAFFVMGEEGARRYCAAHPGTGAVLVLPPKRLDAAAEVVILGAADAEVNS